MEQLVDRAGGSKVKLEVELDFPISALTGSEIYRIANLESGWSDPAFLKERFRERSGVFASRSQADVGRGGQVGRGRSQAQTS